MTKYKEMEFKTKIGEVWLAMRKYFLRIKIKEDFGVLMVCD